jgi:hypothetical protein
VTDIKVAVMPSDFDDSDFVDNDFQASPKTPHPLSSGLNSPSPAGANKPPTRDELNVHVSEAHQKLAELKRAQEELEQKRAALEEERRRQMEFQTGRQEMIQHLTRGVGLLEESEFAARREAEQMAKTLAEMRDALSKVQSIGEAQWTTQNYQIELTRGLTTIENARMEWNSARLKWPILSGQADRGQNEPATKNAILNPLLAAQSFRGLWKIGLAFTWPLAFVALLVAALLIVVLIRR